MAETTNAIDLPLSDRQDMGLLGTPAAPPEVAINSAGRPYDPATGKLLPADSVPEEPIHAEPPTVTTQTKHSRELYDAASFFGISESEADTIEPPMLRKMLRTMTRQQERERDANERARFWEQQKQVQAVQPATPPAPEPEFDLDGEIDPAISPKMHKFLKGLFDENRELRKHVGRLDQLEQRERFRGEQSYWDACDEAFQELGDPRFGEGSREELLGGADKEAMEFRQTIINAAGVDTTKHTASQAKRLIKAAHKRLYPDGAPKKTPSQKAADAYGGAPASAEPPKPNGKRITEEQWQRGAVGAPTRRAAEELPQGREKAIAAVAGMMGKQSPQFEADAEIRAGLFRKGAPPA